ncbi:2-keto-4-pentenoate hydratase [Thalassobaculum litoreum]|uniref:2-oxo-3-hexenedioate decarboxylase n=1 Tax=Thalassobaculum litoreum DSM 18839 TaxID=1123362 RepID=A0A8G2BG28_9PROT|nr:sulfate adenylyltransferase [Thalassobaculum litoreum]SDF46057.1 2-oxo-3-hexenedioate decarboxylase [Thalassobaculum litoreum DSM 18839]
MNPDRQADLADHLVKARTGGAATPLPPAELEPDSVEDGYAVQALVHDRLEAAGFGPRTGHKIGCTTSVMQAYLKIDHPCAGEVFGSTVSEHMATLPLSRFHRVGVECEIAARLGADLPDTGAPYDRDGVAPAVEALMPGIEIVDDRYTHFPSFSAPVLIADDFFNAGVVLGDPLKNWRGLDLDAIVGEMFVDKVRAGSGRGRDILGHPMNALAWLANHRVALGRPLQAGEFVMLGSVVKTIHFTEPAEVLIRFEHLGEARVRFT